MKFTFTQILTLILITVLTIQNDVFAQSPAEIIELGEVTVRLEEDNANSVKIAFDFHNKNYKVTELLVENPTRIVFDIEGLVLKGGMNITLKSSSLKQARVGVHKDKTRIVFDANKKNLTQVKSLAGADKPVFRISETGSTEAKMEEPLPISTNSPLATIQQTPEPTKAPIKLESKPPTSIPSIIHTPSPTPVPPTPTPIDVEDTEANNEIKETPQAKAHVAKEIVQSNPNLVTPEKNESIKDVEKKLQPKIEEKSAIGHSMLPNGQANKAEEIGASARIEQASPQATSDLQIVIKSIVFQTTAEKMQSSMVISTSSPISYSINQISKTNYELIVPGTKLKGEHLKLPQFPPDSFKGFLYFQANETPTGTNIKIEVEEGVQLTPYLAMGKLWIRAE